MKKDGDRLIEAFSLVVLGLMLLSAANAETGKPPDARAAQRGERLYEKYCASCHGVNGVGESPVPWGVRRPDYVPAPALDDSQHAWHHSDENLITVIMNGSARNQRMPAWKNVISERDARDLVNYMKSLWSPRAIECQGPKHMSCM